MTTVKNWSETDATVSLHDNHNRDVLDPSPDEIVSVINNLGISPDSEEFDFVIMHVKESFLGKNITLQTITERGSGSYIVESLIFTDMETDTPTKEAFRLTTTNVNEVSRLFCDFSSGTVPNISTWDDVSDEVFPKS